MSIVTLMDLCPMIVWSAFGWTPAARGERVPKVVEVEVAPRVRGERHNDVLCERTLLGGWVA